MEIKETSELLLQSLVIWGKGTVRVSLVQDEVQVIVLMLSLPDLIQEILNFPLVQDHSLFLFKLYLLVFETGKRILERGILESSPEVKLINLWANYPNHKRLVLILRIRHSFRVKSVVNQEWSLRLLKTLCSKTLHRIRISGNIHSSMEAVQDSKIWVFREVLNLDR